MRAAALLAALALPQAEALCNWSWHPKRFGCQRPLDLPSPAPSVRPSHTPPSALPALACLPPFPSFPLLPLLLPLLLLLLAAAAAFYLGRASRRPRPPPPPPPLRTLDIPLWSGSAHPRMRLFFPPALPADAACAAFVVLRGGGFYSCMGSGEGAAAWAARAGMVGVEVEYAAVRGAQPIHGPAGAEGALPPLPQGEAAYPQCVDDACRAVRLLRKMGADGRLPIDGARVAVCGFSAGGHLAALLATRHESALTVSAKDELSGMVSCRPDRAVLCYAVTMLTRDDDPEKMANVAVNLLGAGCHDMRLKKALSPALHVGRATPPLFIWCTADDPTVPSAHSIALYTAARAAGVAAELHVYHDAVKGGAHAQGMAEDNPCLRGWADQCLAWLGPAWCAHRARIAPPAASASQ